MIFAESDIPARKARATVNIRGSGKEIDQTALEIKDLQVRNWGEPYATKGGASTGKKGKGMAERRRKGNSAIRIIGVPCSTKGQHLKGKGEE